MNDKYLLLSSLGFYTYHKFSLCNSPRTRIDAEAHGEDVAIQNFQKPPGEVVHYF